MYKPRLKQKFCAAFALNTEAMKIRYRIMFDFHQMPPPPPHPEGIMFRFPPRTATIVISSVKHSLKSSNCVNYSLSLATV